MVCTSWAAVLGSRTRVDADNRSLTNPLTGEPDAGDPPVRFGGRGSGQPLSLPLSFSAPDMADSGFSRFGSGPGVGGQDLLQGRMVHDAMGFHGPGHHLWDLLEGDFAFAKGFDGYFV